MNEPITYEMRALLISKKSSEKDLDWLIAELKKEKDIPIKKMIIFQIKNITKKIDSASLCNLIKHNCNLSSEELESILKWQIN